MPALFPEVWLNRVRRLFTNEDNAPWLEGIEELPSAVTEMGAGSDGETNLVRIPLTDFEPDVLINNSAYPIAIQAYTDTEAIIALDKYQTKATSLSDDEVIGASYDRIDSATKGHVKAIRKNKFWKAIYSLAPNANTALTPVLECTGAVIGSRKKLLVADLIKLKGLLDAMQAPEDGRRLVLSSEHFNDLLEDGSDEIKRQLFNYQKGKTSEMVLGFMIYQYNGNPYYSQTGDKLAYGAIPVATDRRGSVLFLESNTVKKTGLTKQYFKKASGEPQTQANLLNYRHYFIATKLRERYSAVFY